MNIPTTSYDEYLKRDVGDFNPETAAYLYIKENQSEGKLQTRHPLVRLITAKPWLLAIPAILLFWLGSQQQPKFQTIQTAPAGNAPYIININ